MKASMAAAALAASLFATCLLAACLPAMPASAFQNPEADALYDGAFREMVLKQYTAAVKALEAQAERSQTPLPPVAIQKLKQELYDNAYLRGRCADRAISLHKQEPKKYGSNVFAYAELCFRDHVGFFRVTMRARNSFSIRYCSENSKATNAGNKPYDFLSIEGTTTPVANDFVAWRECVENRSEADKLLDIINTKPRTRTPRE
jgi:hypothetical protein